MMSFRASPDLQVGSWEVRGWLSARCTGVRYKLGYRCIKFLVFERLGFSLL